MKKQYRLVGVWFCGHNALQNEIYDHGSYETQEEAEAAVTPELFKERDPDFIMVVPVFNNSTENRGEYDEEEGKED